MSGTFEFHGETFTYAETFPDFAYAEFCEAMDEGAEASNAHATAVTLRLAMSSIAEDDQARFRRACRKNKVGTENYLQVFKDFIEVLAARPTTQPTDSSDGPVVTPEKSESQPAVSVTSLPAPEPTRPVRPDLQLAVSRSA